MARTTLSVLVREWPLVAAALALASLALLPRFARSQELLEERERAVIEELRRRVDLEPSKAEPLVRAFIATRGESRRLPEAKYLLGRAIVLAARGGEFPGPHALGVAWHALSAARGGGFEADRTWPLQREIARLLDERDYFREAVARYNELVRVPSLPDVALDLARALARRALHDPAAREALLGEAADLVSGFLRAAPREDRLQAFLVQADVYWRAGRYEEMLPILERELGEFLRAADKGRLQLERGKALTRLRREEARAALDEAERLLGGTKWHDHALLFQAILHQRAGSGECPEVCERLFRNKSALAPVARLVLGLHELGIRGRTVDPLAALSAGLAEIRRPAIFDETGFDFGEFYDQVRRAWDQEGDRAALVRYAGLYRDLSRLYPASTVCLLDHARLWLKAGEHAKAADRFLAAAAVFAAPAERELAVREAARVCFEGGLYPRAAALYRRYYELRPRANVEGLYWQGEALRHARCYRDPSAGEADALSVFAEFVARAKADDPLLPRALLYRGRMFAELGMREDAVEEFGRILQPGGAPAIDPRAPEFAEGLLGRGRALLELVAGMPADDAANRRLKLASEARKDLGEYLERYSDSFDHRTGAVEACYLLARAAIAEREWAAAMEELVRIESLAGAESEFREQARFLRGDVLLGQGLWEKAVEAYSEAYRAYLRSDERLWGLIGRARAYLHLGRRDEARRDYENGKAIYDEKKDAFDKSLAGRGREVWGPALEALGKELLH